MHRLLLAVSPVLILVSPLYVIVIVKVRSTSTCVIHGLFPLIGPDSESWMNILFVVKIRSRLDRVMIVLLILSI